MSETQRQVDGRLSKLKLAVVQVKLGYGTATPDNASFSDDATPPTTVS